MSCPCFNIKKWISYVGKCSVLACLSAFDILHLLVFQLVVQTSDGREVTLDWDRVRSFEKEIATMFMLQVKEFEEAL